MASESKEYTDTLVPPAPELLKFGGLIKGNAMAAFYLVASHEELGEGATVSLWTVILTDLFLRNEEDGFMMQVNGVLLRMTNEGKSIRMIISEFKRKGKDTPEERRRNEKQLAEHCHEYLERDGTPSYCFAMSAIGTHAKIFTFKKSVGVLEPLWESSEDDLGYKDAIDDGDFLRGYFKQIKGTYIE